MQILHNVLGNQYIQSLHGDVDTYIHLDATYIDHDLLRNL